MEREKPDPFWGQGHSLHSHSRFLPSTRSKLRLCLLVAWNNSQTLVLWKHSWTRGTTTELPPSELPYRSSPSSWKDQEAAWKVKKPRSKLFLPRMKPANMEVPGFSFGWVAFPKQPLVSHCSTANKAAAEGDLLLQWSWLHTLSNLHNLPHNLNQSKCTPGDYFQKPIWKNIHCLTPKKTRGKEAKWQGLQLMRRKKRSKRSNRNKDLAFTFLSIFLRISLW